MASKRSLQLFQRSPGFTAAGAGKVRQALADDASKDVTTQALRLSGQARAFVVARHSGVLCGVPEAQEALKGLSLHWRVKEGQEFRKGQRLVEIKGGVSRLLAAERTALNYLMLLSGIATQTRRWVNRYGRRVATLRKTHPLLSAAEKRAVRVGGGLTHRLSLLDGYLVKENHASALARQERISIPQALRLAVRKAKFHRRGGTHVFVEVEVGNLQEALAAAEEGPDALLIDNCTPSQVRKIVLAVRRKHPGLLLEASGGISFENAGHYLAAGADFVSTSALTLRAKPVDLSLLVE